MKKLLALVLSCLFAVALCACTVSGGSFGVESDNGGVHAKAEGAADGSANGSITIGEGEGMCINHIVEKGSFQVKATDSTGKVVFDKEITDNIADYVDVQGEIELVLTANDATGTIDIIAYDKESMAQADAALDDALKQTTGKDAQEMGVNKTTWSEAKTAEEAAQGAGIDGFAVPEAGTKVSIGKLGDWSFVYKKDKAEADGYAAAAGVVIRKSLGNGDNTSEPSTVTSGWNLADVTYAEEWNEDMGGVDVRCYGAKEGTVSKAIWAKGKYSYSVLVLGQGDNWSEFGLPSADIAAIVAATK